MQIGQHIKQRRLALGATLEQIAFEANMDASNLSRIERGMQQPSSTLLKRIAHALGTSIGKMYDEVETSKPAREKLPAAYDRETQNLLRQFRKLNPENQTLTLEFVRMLGRIQAKS